MALGAHGYLYSAVKAVLPQLGFIRYPIKFVVVAVLVIPALAAYGVSWYQAAPVKAARERITLVNIALILLVLMGLIVWVEWEHPLVRDDWRATWQNAVARAIFLVLIVRILLSLNRVTAFKMQLLLRLSLLLLLWLDVYTHAPNLSPTVTRSVYQPGIIQTELGLPVKTGDNGPRFMETLAAMDKVHYTSLSQPAADYICRRVALFDNCNLLDDVPKIDGFYSLYLRETETVIRLLYGYDAPTNDLKGLKDFLNIAYINPPETSREKALEWARRDSCLPLVTAGQQPLFGAGSNILATLAQTNFNPAQVVCLPTEAKAFITAKQTPAKIISQQIEAQQLKLTVVADAAAMVVVAQSFYHPWQAYVDGNRVKLWPANYAFQAVEIPAGQHEVKLVYRDRVFELGAAISLASLAVLAWIWFRPRRA